MPAETITYKVTREYAGKYAIHASDAQEFERPTASVGRWMPGPMIDYSGPAIMSPALARAVAKALTRLAKDLEAA
jgi:hypothetical protein